MRTAPTRALETILNVHPIEIQSDETENDDQVFREFKSYHQMIIEVILGNSTRTESDDPIPESTIITKCETLIPDARQ